MSLVINLLGPFQAALNNVPLNRFRSNRVQALLIYLVTMPADLPSQRDKLLDLLWPGLPQASAQNNLRQTLYQLRKAIPDAAGVPFLLTDRRTAQRNPAYPCQIDVASFETLAGGRSADWAVAAELYRGDFLSDFYLPDAATFEAWVAGQREVYRRRYLELLAGLVDNELMTGQLDQAEGYARKQLAREPLREVAHRQLMSVLARSGRRDEAVRHYHHCQQLLSAELGLSPALETQALYAQIIANEINQGVWAPRKVTDSEPIAPRLKQNLPGQPTLFVGREKELAQLISLLRAADTRLITLLAPGGMGKTRLALAAAEALLENRATPFVDGIFFVDLAPFDRADDIPHAIADGLKLELLINDENGADQLIIDHLRDKKCLLVLDNYEHLLPDVALLAELIKSAPQVKLLVTSRARLQLRAEQLFAIVGLDLPKPELASPATDYAAGQLFLAAAGRSDTSFAVSSLTEAVQILAICRLVDGMPLALELAAGWVDVLPLSEIAAELRQGLDLLASEMHDLPPRHRSVRAAFDHSWNLLRPAEQDCFAQMSVFRGGFTREAAASVCGADLRLLAKLTNKSFVRLDGARGRYQLHELLRQYGAERLQASQKLETALDKHNTYYLRFVQECEDAMKGAGQLAALAAIDADFDNVRAAALRAAAQGNGGALGPAVEGLWLYFNAQSLWGKGVVMRSQLLDQIAASDEIDLLALKHKIAARHCRPRELAKVAIGQALTFARQQADLHEVATCLVILGEAHLRTLDPEKGASLIAEGLDIFQELGDAFWAHYYRIQLANAFGMQGRSDEAIQLLDESITYLRDRGDQKHCGLAYYEVHNLCWGLGKYDSYQDYINTRLQLHQIVGDKAFICQCRLLLQHLQILHGNWESARYEINAAVQGLSTEDDAIFGVYDKEGWVSLMTSDYARAKEKFTIGLRQMRAVWPWLDALREYSYCSGLTIAHCVLEEYGEAADLLGQAVTRALENRELGNLKLYLPLAAFLFARLDRPERAAELYSLAFASLTGWTGWLEKWDLFLDSQREVENTIGSAAFAQAWQRGGQLELLATAEILLRELADL